MSDDPVTPPTGGDASAPEGAPKRRRRGSRGGRGRSGRPSGTSTSAAAADRNPELPDRASENRPRDPALLDAAVVRKPQIGDTRPAPPVLEPAGDAD
jgi:hypothetical protein